MAAWQPNAGRAVLRRRAELLHEMRAFFRRRSVLEVDTPTLSTAAVSDPNVESLQTNIDGIANPFFLHTSPEFPMKRLLCAGSGDIFQLCKVFRQGEIGRYHNPEFTLLEWYRLGFDHQQLMDEMEVLLRDVTPELCANPPVRVAYHEIFTHYTGVSAESSVMTLRDVAQAYSNDAPDDMRHRDDWLDWLMSTCVVAQLPKDRLTFIYDYPASQAALSRIRDDKPLVAERFELYWGNIELANGFHELADPDEQQARFAAEIAIRQSQGQTMPPTDNALLAALQHGLPDCAGVALGIDRLLMANLNATHIREVLAFTTDNA